MTTGENAIAITEFNISEFQPDRRCPNGGRYHDQIQMQVGTDLPLWFWMRLQGDSSLITRLIARKVTSLPIRATLEVQVAPNTYKPLPGKESVDLTGPLKLDDEVRNEARNSCVKTQEGDGLFDYRMPFYKISGLDDRGGYRVKIEVLEPTVSVICNNSVVCEQDRTDGPFWLTFIK